MAFSVKPYSIKIKRKPQLGDSVNSNKIVYYSMSWAVGTNYGMIFGFLAGKKTQKTKTIPKNYIHPKTG